MDKQGVIAEIQRVAKLLNVSSLTRQQFEASANISATTVRRSFGSWNKAIEAAGLTPITPENQPKNYAATDEEYLQEIIRVTKVLGKRPTGAEFSTDIARYSERPYRARWGTWSNAVDEAYRVYGFPLEDQSKEINESNTPISVGNHSIFGTPSNNPQFERDIFMMMPINKGFEPVYEDNIKPIAAEFNLTIDRGDDFFTTSSVINDIWSAIVASQLVIAECTGRNPNVFYELGIAHTLEKPGILITQNIDDIPFDVGHLRVIEYEYTPRGVQRLEAGLKKALRNLT